LPYTDASGFMMLEVFLNGLGRLVMVSTSRAQGNNA
jgi:hypothetical protein